MAYNFYPLPQNPTHATPFSLLRLLSVQGFFNYMTSREGDAISPAETELQMNMREPLSHYFINSSHNTYLTGRSCTMAACTMAACTMAAFQLSTT